MPKRFRLTPRKEPTQDRSRVTVDAILEATEKVFVQEGYESANTNRVAEVAGVSIGSLYQYFPSKESLLSALAIHVKEEMVQDLSDELLNLSDAPIHEIPRGISSVIFAAYAERLDLMTVIAREAPSVDARRKMGRVHRQLVDVLKGFFEMRKAELRLENPELTAYCLAFALEGALQNAILDRPDEAKSRTMEAEIVALTTGLLRLS
ncbi:MAG: TetR/AcrR family transcriptional regulator [Myxococcota bacterium]